MSEKIEVTELIQRDIEEVFGDRLEAGNYETIEPEKLQFIQLSFGIGGMYPVNLKNLKPELNKFDILDI